MKENMSLEPILSLQTQQDVDKCVDVMPIVGPIVRRNLMLFFVAISARYVWKP